jgi:hypothetical protein
MGVRKLYQDDEEITFDAKRPIILNGIGHIVPRDDLANRSLIIDMKSIEDDQRRVKENLVHEYEAMKPYFLGALFDGVSEALRTRKKLKLTAYQRMADFQHWVIAAERAVFKKEGKFVKLFDKHRREVGLSTLESDPVAEKLNQFLDSNDGRWRGTATALLKLLANLVSDEDMKEFHKEKLWPRAANALSLRLKEMAPALRTVGISIKFGRPSGKRVLQLQKK